MENVKDINQIENYSVDLIYGSHSLEHVQNIEKFKAQVSQVLNQVDSCFGKYRMQTVQVMEHKKDK